VSKARPVRPACRSPAAWRARVRYDALPCGARGRLLRTATATVLVDLGTSANRSRTEEACACVQPVKRRWRQQRRDVTKQISDTQCSAVLIATPTARPVPPWAR